MARAALPPTYPLVWLAGTMLGHAACGVVFEELVPGQQVNNLKATSKC